MKPVIRRLAVGLMVVAGLAGLLLTTGMLGSLKPQEEQEQQPLPPSPVSTIEAKLESIEITDTYAGMIRPKERFLLGFEIGGRLVSLGSSSKGEPLDEGDRVTAGQTLARLDDRVLRACLEETRARLVDAQARVKDAAARLEQAQSDMQRVEKLRYPDQRSIGSVISESEYQEYVTQLSVAEAQVEIARAQVEMTRAQLATAEKNLEDATLLSPLDGVISRRRVNIGESVNPNQQIFDILDVARVLLVVGVPEAFVGEIRLGQPAYVELLAANRFRAKRPRPSGTVYRVAQAADDTTGLFEVEVILENSGGPLKPGLIGLAHIVVDRVEGFRVPEASVVLRDGQSFLFSVNDENVAHALRLTDWIEQGGDLILRDLPAEHRQVVVRGQHRLIDGRGVTLVDMVPGRTTSIDVSLRNHTTQP